MKPYLSHTRACRLAFLVTLVASLGFVINKHPRPTTQIGTVPKKLYALNLRKLKENDKHGMVVVVANQPKCGTGTLFSSIRNGLACAPGGQAGPFVGGRQRASRWDCSDGRTLLKTHYANDAQIALQDLRGEGKVGEGKCLVLTAVRDPLTLLPSRFAQRYGKGLCEGRYKPDEVKKMYREYLQDLPEKWEVPLYDDTFALLKAFGGASISEELQKQELGGGYSYLRNPSADGSWRGCELLFLRTEFSSKWPGLLSSATLSEIKTSLPRTLKCDEGDELISEIKDSTQYWDEIVNIARARPIFGEVMEFYGHQFKTAVSNPN